MTSSMQLTIISKFYCLAHSTKWTNCHTLQVHIICITFCTKTEAGKIILQHSEHTSCFLFSSQNSIYLNLCKAWWHIAIWVEEISILLELFFIISNFWSSKQTYLNITITGEYHPRRIFYWNRVDRYLELISTAIYSNFHSAIFRTSNKLHHV